MKSVKPIDSIKKVNLMSQIQEKEAKLLIDSGAIGAVVVRSSPMDKGYIIMLRSKNQKSIFDYVISLQRGGERVFKTLDAAAATVKAIGIAEFAVDMK